MSAFRSVSIADDLHRSGAVESFRPTRKAMRVVEAVAGGGASRATSVVAAYGTGKSMAALVGLQLLIGDSRKTRPLRRRIAEVDERLAKSLAAAKGEAIVLHGACGDLCGELARQAGIRARADVTETLRAIAAKAQKGGVRRIAIVWDEFGVHLETLARDGRMEGLLEVQQMAEWAVRLKRPAATLTTLMHRGVHSYTRRLSDSAKSDWKKIEGRFEPLTLEGGDPDDYEMIAEELDRPRKDGDARLAARARKAGFFAEFADDESLAAVLSRTDPLTPAALDILPRLAGMVAQSERTMFGFLREVVAPVAPGRRIGLADLYDHFAPAMRADTGPGGTYRRLMEAETAISRAESSLERAILKSIALLQLGPAGERTQLPRARLAFAVAQDEGATGKKIDATLKALVERKLVVHRRRQDDILIWSGSDLDLEDLVRQEAARLDSDHDVVLELQEHFPAPAYLAPRYNHENSITRYARGRYAVADDLLDPQRRQALELAAASEDALVALVIDATADRRDLIKQAGRLPENIMVALPEKFANIRPMMLETAAIRNLRKRDDLAGEDPLVAGELDMMLGEVETALRNAIEPVINPDRGQVAWFAGKAAGAAKARGGGKPSRHSSLAEAGSSGELLSRLFERRFSHAPRIGNEQVVRRRVSRTSRSSRKRCILAVLERTGLPSLGYADGATAADASVYRTVFAATGLYRKSKGEWGWARPASIKDPALRRVWSALEKFFDQPSAKRRSFADLLASLTSPPIGLREGLLPLMAAAGFQAFGKCLALRENIDGAWLYVDDVTPSLIERICEEPSSFDLESRRLSASQRQQLERMVVCLAGEVDPREPDLVRAFHDALLAWRSGLPASALSDPHLGECASLVQPLLRKRGFDPFDFLFADLPAAVGCDPLHGEAANCFVFAVSDIEEAEKRIAEAAIDVAYEILNRRIPGADQPLLKAAAAWAAALPLGDAAMRALDQETRGIVSRARAADQELRTETGFVTALSGILFGTGFDEWTEASALRFRERLDGALERAEQSAFENADGSRQFDLFARNRMSSVVDQIADSIGWRKTRQHLESIIKERTR